MAQKDQKDKTMSGPQEVENEQRTITTDADTFSAEKTATGPIDAWYDIVMAMSDVAKGNTMTELRALIRGVDNPALAAELLTRLQRMARTAEAAVSLSQEVIATLSNPK